MRNNAHDVRQVSNRMLRDSHTIRHGSHTIRHGSHTGRHGSHTVRHGSHTVRHGSHNVRHCSHNVKHGSHNVRHGAHNVRHSSHTMRFLQCHVYTSLVSTAKESFGTKALHAREHGPCQTWSYISIATSSILLFYSIPRFGGGGSV